MKIVQDNLWLCEDCLIVAVNGDTSGIESAERIAEVNAGLDRLGTHLEPYFDSETGDGVLSFSWRTCDSCRGGGGSRYRFAILAE